MPSHEEVSRHGRMLKLALNVEHSRAYWRHHRIADNPEQDPKPDLNEEAELAFREFWFGTRSFAAVKNLLLNFHHRFQRFPTAMRALSHYPPRALADCQLICHWHLQLSDPIYREFSGRFLVQRQDSLRGTVTRDAVIQWVDRLDEQKRWTRASHIQLASKLLSAAHEAGLVQSARDPRPLQFPPVPDMALGYLLHLLRNVEFQGALHDNLYLRSVGLHTAALDHRLRTLPGLKFRRIGDVADFEWQEASLMEWMKGRS